MDDVDERDARAGSFSRYNYQNDTPQGSRDVDVVANLISDYEYATDMGDREKLDLLRKVEAALKKNPENCTKAPKFISQLLTHPNVSIRKSAFNCALTILSNPKNPKTIILNAYRLAFCCSNKQVAQHALCLLPEFVTVCPEESANLIKFGTVALRKLPAPSTDTEQMTVSFRERRVPRLHNGQEAINHFEKYRRIRTTDMKVQQCQTISFNCDGTRLICGANDRKVSVANVDGGRLKFSWIGSSHQSSVEQVACSMVSPHMFASASSDKSVCVWDIRQSKPSHRISNKSGNVYIAWSPCDNYFVFGDKDSFINVVDSRNYQVVNNYDIKQFSHECVFHPKSNHLLVASSYGKVEIFNFSSGSLDHVSTIQAHSPQVDCLAIAVTRDGQKLAVGASDASCSLWNLDELICERVIPRHDYNIRSVSFSCNGQILASGSEDHSIDLVYVPDGSRCHEIKNTGETFSVTWHPSQLLLAYASADAHNKRDSSCVKTFGHST
ncbi:unnamed protein product [Caenorhabditis bovis]|uniref:Integrator complex subunit 1 R4 domain-containing protein n=1 Tax=Caenorhabditis bovis TaxID=2654633 RepID=A0A8S1EY01_9PELO|nr:unnamed protein product [Caenorhabditis bovis]